MKYKEKMTASEMRTLWGSRIVIWITILVVMFPVAWIVMSSFSAGDSFFLSSLFSREIQCGALCDTVSGNRFYNLGIEFIKILLHSCDHSINSYFLGSVCICQASVCWKEVWINVPACATGVSEQYGSGRLLYLNLSVRIG